jgi:hypothetical protein
MGNEFDFSVRSSGESGADWAAAYGRRWWDRAVRRPIQKPERIETERCQGNFSVVLHSLDFPMEGHLYHSSILL